MAAELDRRRLRPADFTLLFTCFSRRKCPGEKAGRQEGCARSERGGPAEQAASVLRAHGTCSISSVTPRAGHPPSPQ